MGKDPLQSFALRFVCSTGGAKTGLVLLGLETCAGEKSFNAGEKHGLLLRYDGIFLSLNMQVHGQLQLATWALMSCSNGMSFSRDLLCDVSCANHIVVNKLFAFEFHVIIRMITAQLPLHHRVLLLRCSLFHSWLKQLWPSGWFI